MTTRLLVFVLTCVVLSSCGTNRRGFAQRELIYSPVGIPPKPDYANEKYWAALPQRKDLADSTPQGLKDMQATARADVFFVHPTTFRGETKEGVYHWNADVNDDELNKTTDATTILYQASVFNGSCKIYAPRYRQAHLSVFFTKDTATYFGPLAIAYDDVKEAFRYYVNHYNNGRPFIIASHSQGTVLARRLVRDVIEADSALNKKMIAAYLVGYAVLEDSFVTLKPCATPDQTQCFCSWNTFATNYFPPWYNDGLYKAHATNPLTWTTDTLIASSDLNKGGVLQNFEKIVPNVVDAQVKAGMVWVNKPNVTGAGLLNIKNYHIGDYNLFYVNIRENVQQRVDAYFNKIESSR